jgi:hypothetical protein
MSINGNEINEELPLDLEEGSDPEGRDFEAEARDMGWVEETKFRGPKGQWVDAKTFVEKGENILPILKATRDKLREENLTKDREIANLRKTVEENQKAVRALQKAHTDETERRVNTAIRETKEKIKLARDAGDIDAELELQDTLNDLKDTKAEVKKIEQTEERPKHPNASESTEFTPEFVQWQKENKWFGDMEDPTNRKRTREIIRIGEDLRDEGEERQGKVFFDYCLELLEEKEATRNGNRPQVKKVSRVEGSDNAARRTSGRAFDNLPKEAKSACHEDNDLFVGPGKKHKTVKDWEDEYARIYLAQD